MIPFQTSKRHRPAITDQLVTSGILRPRPPTAPRHRPAPSARPRRARPREREGERRPSRPAAEASPPIEVGGDVFEHAAPSGPQAEQEERERLIAAAHGPELELPLPPEAVRRVRPRDREHAAGGEGLPVPGRRVLQSPLLGLPLVGAGRPPDQRAPTTRGVPIISTTATASSHRSCIRWKAMRGRPSRA